MPPKKGKKEKGKKGKKSANPEANPENTGEPSEREQLLQKELDDLTAELEAIKKRCEQLREENDFMQQEAAKIRLESHEYMSYMDKKTQKRQTSIITLSDQNTKEIQDIVEQKMAVIAEFEEKKAQLRAVMLDKESQLAKAKQELDDLVEYKNLQQQQLNRIKELEREVTNKRAAHTNVIQELKSKFLTEKQLYQEDSRAKVGAMTKKANVEALRCLNEHTDKIKLENRQLRHTLLKLIRKSRALAEHKRELEEQRKLLLAESQYAHDLKAIRASAAAAAIARQAVRQDEDDDEEQWRQQQQRRQWQPVGASAGSEAAHDGGDDGSSEDENDGRLLKVTDSLPPLS